MNLDSLRKSIVQHEGYGAKPYQDHLGIWTVGYGHNIHGMSMRDAHLQTFGSFMDWLCDKTTHEAWLDEDLGRAITDARKWLGSTWNTLSDTQQEVVAEMAFQLGATRLAMFVKFKAAIVRGDWQAAKAEMLDSRWYQQTPRRATLLANKFVS